MDKFDRIFELHRILSTRRSAISADAIATRMECTAATAKRIIRLLRESLNAPIIYNREQNGYYYQSDPAQPTFELPGLWFSEAELLSLLTLMQLLQRLEPGLLADYLNPFNKRLNSLLQHRHLGLTGVDEKVRILAKAGRPSGPWFNTIAAATLGAKRLHITYRSRNDDEQTQREISPLRLVHYRDSWYLDAWCHLREALRNFSIDRITQVSTTSADIKAISIAETEAHYASSYGIYSGIADQSAILLFSAAQARWVESEQWHPQQQGHYLEDGRYQLQIPYHNDQELIMDILRYGPEVEVVAPPTLRQVVATRLREALEKY